MKYTKSGDGVRRANIVVRCRFTEAEIKRINRAAKLRGIKPRYMLRSWLELVMEDELNAVEEEYGIEE